MIRTVLLGIDTSYTSPSDEAPAQRKRSLKDVRFVTYLLRVDLYSEKHARNIKLIFYLCT